MSDTGVGTPWRRPRRPMTPLRASHSRARPARRSVRIEEPASFGSASIQAMTSSASLGGQLDPLGAGDRGALVGERAGDLAHVVEGEDLGRAARERHHARDRVGAQLAPGLELERAADGDLGVLAQQRREPLPRRPVRHGEAQRVALAHATGRDRLDWAPVDDGEHLRVARPAGPTRSA